VQKKSSNIANSALHRERLLAAIVFRRNHLSPNKNPDYARGIIGVS
jgi:hypothetical protein